MKTFMGRRAALSLLAGVSARMAMGARRADAADGVPLTLQAAYINDAEFLGYYVGLEKGFYRQDGVALTYLSGGPDIIPESSLIAGNADIALTEPDTAIRAITRDGAPFVVIGAQFQKSPMGVISLSTAPIRNPADLAGKTLSVSAVSLVLVKQFLKINGLGPRDVRIVPDTASDPTQLLNGTVDASCGFVTDYPFMVREHGHEPVSFLLSDFGLDLFNNTVVATRDALRTKRAALVGFLKASRQGWTENLRDPLLYPKLYHDGWLRPAGRSVAYDQFSNAAYKPLMECPGGLFSMASEAIERNVTFLNRIGVPAKTAHFDASLMSEL